MTPSGLKPATSWLVAFRLNHLRYRVLPLLYLITLIEFKPVFTAELSRLK
jgi:hypothetical protein